MMELFVVGDDLQTAYSCYKPAIDPSVLTERVFLQNLHPANQGFHYKAVLYMLQEGEGFLYIPQPWTAAVTVQL